MSNSDLLRQASVSAIRRLEQAERIAKQSGDTAASQKQTTLNTARQKDAQLRQQADKVLQETRSLAKRGDGILAELKLQAASAGRPSPAAPVTPDQAIALLQSHRAKANEGLIQLMTTAKELKEERRKWWKFW